MFPIPNVTMPAPSVRLRLTSFRLPLTEIAVLDALMAFRVTRLPPDPSGRLMPTAVSLILSLENSLRVARLKAPTPSWKLTISPVVMTTPSAFRANWTPEPRPLPRRVPAISSVSPWFGTENGSTIRAMPGHVVARTGSVALSFVLVTTLSPQRHGPTPSPQFAARTADVAFGPTLRRIDVSVTSKERRLEWRIPFLSPIIVEGVP